MNYILDTHVLVWAFLEPKKLTQKHKTIFKNQGHHFIVPVISLLEVQYLIEIKRIAAETGDFLIEIKNRENFSLASFDEGILLHSIKLTTNRDPFDRMILAHALATSTHILTRDKWMKKMAPNIVI